MPAYRIEAKVLLDDRDRIAKELATVTVSWNRARASGSGPSEIRTLNTEIAALNERLNQIDAALAAFET